MKLRFILTAAVLGMVLAADAKEYKYEEVKGDPLKTRIYTLDNGLKVYLSVNNEKPRIQTYIAVRTGSRNDPAETTGLAHYLEHLMFKGTKQFGTSNYKAELPLLNRIETLYEEYRQLKDPQERKAKYHEIDSISQLAARYNIPNEYDKLMAAIGAIGTNAWTSDDCTNYTEDIPSNEIENWAKVQSDRFKDMVIRGFHTELEAVYEEYNISLTRDASKQYDAMRALLYPNHPYGTQTTIGTQEHLKNPSIVNIKNYFHKYYCPNNVAICMAGDFQYDEVMAIIDKYFGDWKSNPNCSYPQYAPVKDLTHVMDTTVVGPEAETVLMGWKFDNAASKQCDTLMLVEQILSNGKAGLIDLNLNQTMKIIDGNAGAYCERDYSTFMMQGTPNNGQSLDEVKDLLLGQFDLVKTGDFDENMLTAIINNMKLNQYREMESNSERARMFVDAFVYGLNWKDEVEKINRLAKITKQDVVDFANKHFGDNYVVSYKRMGEDKNQKKIDKPAITPIPSNREMQSAFVKEITESQSKPIQPKFVDFDKDLTKTTTKAGLPVMYVQNKDNGLFTLAFRYEFGGEADKRLPFATQYSSFLGTDKKSAAQLRQEYYQLACNSRISCSDDALYIFITGLAENMDKALVLTEDFLQNIKVDEEAWKQYVASTIKNRSDEKLSQKYNFMALINYGAYGEYNSQRNTLNNQELSNTNPATLVELIKNLKKYKHEVLYYGPLSTQEIIATVDKYHNTDKNLTDGPKNKEYVAQTTPKNEVYIAPYDAKNLYLVQLHNENKEWDPSNQAVISLFNEYYGSGMNAVVFQELRETRGLAYSAAASYNVPEKKGEKEMAETYIISQNDKMPDCVSTFHEILENMPQSEKAFDLAKQSLTKKLQTKRTTKFNIINRYITARNKGLDYDIDKSVYEKLPSLTLQDIVDFEKANMAGKTWRYIILADEKNIDMETVNKLGKVTRLSTDEIFGY